MKMKIRSLNEQINCTDFENLNKIIVRTEICRIFVGNLLIRNYEII
jgi:hypothetical protein